MVVAFTRGWPTRVGALALRWELALLVLVGACDQRAPSAPLAPTSSTQLSAPSQAVTVLPPQAEAWFTAAEGHCYSLDLESGLYFRLIVEQLGTDVVVSLHAPEGGVLAETDDLDGSWGPEELVWLTGLAGIYELRIRPWQAPLGPPEPALSAEGPAARGHPRTKERGPDYRLTLDGPRLPLSEDRLRLQAAKALRRAEEFENSKGGSDDRQALAAYAKAAQAYGQIDDHLRQSVVHLRLGRMLARRGQIKTSLRHFQRAQALLQKFPCPGQEAGLLTSMARAYRLTGQPQQALSANSRALEIYRELGDRRGEALALNNLAVVYDNSGEIGLALEHYEAALTLWRELPDVAEQANTLHNLGTLYSLVGRDLEAMDFLLQALELRRHVGDRRGEAATLTALGWGHFLRGDPAAAEAALRSSLQMRRQVADRRGEATTLDRLGTVLTSQQRYGEAQRTYRRAQSLLEDSGDGFGLANILSNLAILYRDWGRTDAALSTFRQALPLLHTVGDRHAEAAAWLGYARTQRAAGDIEAANRTLEQLLALLSAQRQTVPRSGLSSAFLDARFDAYEFAIDVQMELDRQRPGEGWSLKAFQTSEQGRAQGLLRALRTAGRELDEELPSALRQRRRRLTDALADLQIAALAAPPSSPGAKTRDRELRQRLLDLDRVRGDTQRWSVRHAAFADPLPLDQAALQDRLLDPETALLYFSLGEERSFLWWITREAFRVFELPPRKRLEDAAGLLHRLLAASHQRTARAQANIAARELSQLLLGPAAEVFDDEQLSNGQLLHRRLLIVADGALHYVPGGILSLPSALDEPLLARYEVVQVPSLAVLETIRANSARRTPAPKLLAVVADPVLEPDDPRLLSSTHPVRQVQGDSPSGVAFTRLKYAGQEAEQILRQIPPGQSLALLGFDANRRQVLSGRLGGYRILHFATHGLLDSERPQLSALALSSFDRSGRIIDGLLRAHELYDLSLSADLVVLSACRTGLGQKLRGEGLVGLTDGLLYAGATRVVVSLWQVSDRATTELMRRFYSGLLRERLPAAAALRQAQLSLARENPWRSPYFWGGFVLIGDWQENPPVEPSN